MNAADRSELLRVLQRRCDTIADSWYQAIARTNNVPHSAAEVRQHLVGLTEQAIALLLADPLEYSRAEAIGTSLARLHCIDPEVLGRTQGLLAQQLVQGLPADQVVALQPRLATLLSRLAAGFFQQAREAILAEQEQIRGPLISDLQRTEGALRKAYDEVERCVRERTAELVVVNEELRREIAERERVEKALRESEERFQQVAENAQEWVWEVDARGLYTYASPIVEKILGYEPEEIVGKKHFYDLFHPEDREKLKKAAFEVFAQKQSFRGFINRNVHQDGETVWLLTGGVPVLDEEENLLGFRGADTDITERKRADEALRRAYEELERRVEERTAELTAANEELKRQIEERQRAEEELRDYTERMRQLARQIVSAQEDERQRLSRALHDEAGQALTALRISLELIQEDLPPESSSLQQRIGNAAVLASATMEQLRLLAQDLRPPALDTVGLNPTLKSFCGDFAARTRLSIEYLGLELPMLPEAVNTCLYRFLQEALTNVAKHARANRVWVALRYDAETVSLSVEDDGRGFDMQARLSEQGWPMGIGLLGMRERLESLGGRLEIQSRPGQGTRLVAYLPAGGIP